MKNLTLLAALAACGVGVANAQTYVTDQPGIANTNGDTYYAFQLDDVTVQNLQDAGKTVFDYRRHAARRKRASQCRHTDRKTLYRETGNNH